LGRAPWPAFSRATVDVEIEGGVEQVEANLHNRVAVKPVESIPDSTAITRRRSASSRVCRGRSGKSVKKWVVRAGGTELAEVQSFLSAQSAASEIIKMRDEI
jgi:hypothetical protein